MSHSQRGKMGPTYILILADILNVLQWFWHWRLWCRWHQVFYWTTLLQLYLHFTQAHTAKWNQSIFCFWVQWPGKLRSRLIFHQFTFCISWPFLLLVYTASRISGHHSFFILSLFQIPSLQQQLNMFILTILRNIVVSSDFSILVWLVFNISCVLAITITFVVDKGSETSFIFAFQTGLRYKILHVT